MKKLAKAGEYFLKVPAWAFFIAFILSLLISLSALRHNNLHMSDLRNKLYAADKAGGDINDALNDLRDYVYAHMNTNLSGPAGIKPPIQLKYTYERLQKAEQARADVVNAKIYTDAQNFCQAQDPNSFSGRNRVPCVQNYVTSHGAKANTIPTALYQFDFVSPTWSPDFAGWSVVLTSVLLLAFVVSYSYAWLARRSAHHLP